MTLAAGARLGHYELVGEIGAGGMGVVYRARDTTLEREVAIKVLPESLAADPERMARLEREARTLASLNHANIAHVYGLERDDGRLAVVMELVEGQSLADRIAQGPIRPDEALGIATQIADALEGAHEQGIVHRDLKPANVKLGPDGTAKVLDSAVAAIGLVMSSMRPAPEPGRLERFMLNLPPGERLGLDDQSGSLSVSPDGSRIVFSTTPSPYVRPFPEVDAGRWVVSAGGGIVPVWAPDGRTLYFLSETSLMAVEIEVTSTDATFAWRTPEPVLDRGPYFFSPQGEMRPYDVSVDGLTLKRDASQSEEETETGLEGRVVVVRNWLAELERLAPENQQADTS